MKASDEISLYERYFKDPLHLAGHLFRQLLKWERGLPLVLPHEDKDDLFCYLDDEGEKLAAAKREGDLSYQYRLEDLKRHSLRRLYCENLYLLDELENLFSSIPSLPAPSSPGTPLLAIDVGCRNWDYVFALHKFLLKKANVSCELHGVEVDAYGIYPDLHSRFDHARAFMKQAGDNNIHYHPMDFLDFPCRPAQILFLFYPFLTQRAQVKWGLPLKFWRPQSLLQKAVETLAPGGILVVFNQTSREHHLLREGLRGTPMALQRSHPIASKLVPYFERAQDRWSALYRKDHLTKSECS